MNRLMTGSKNVFASHSTFRKRSLIKLFSLTLLIWAASCFNAHAYVLRDTAVCTPGQKWGTANTVKVRLLSESFTAYIVENNIAGEQVILDLVHMLDDIEAVITEYNSIRGVNLVLERADDIMGDNDLGTVVEDNYNNHSIIIGFTGKDSDNPAWTNFDPNDDCTFSEVHIRFRKPVVWTFGAPATTDVNGKSFDGGTSFRAVLLHEMGHAIGLKHETNEYAVMDHGTKAWTRGNLEVPQMELLPDDMQGIRALYGNGGATNFDVSVTNTWFLDETHYPDDNAAHQEQHCKVSTRGDDYTEIGSGLVYCGVNNVPSAYPSVSRTVCPGNYVMVRFTLNNKSAETLLVQEQLWFSLDEDLEVNGPAVDIQSDDIRETMIDPEKSIVQGRVFRVPSDTPNGTYRVFPRVVPYDPQTSASKWSQDEDLWNNSIRVRGTIAVNTAACQ